MDREKGSEPTEGNGFASGRGKETLFRVAARNQIELIAIADNKANIVIGINVLLITVVIAMIGADVTIGGTPVLGRIEFLLPLGTLVLFCLASAVLAIIAAKPKIIKPKRSSEASKLFFQNFYTESLEEYIADMHAILSSRDAIYRQMIIDMYNNGLILREKYNHLTRSYNILMAGLIAGVLVFLVMLVITG